MTHPTEEFSHWNETEGDLTAQAELARYSKTMPSTSAIQNLDLPKDGTLLKTEFSETRTAESLTGGKRKWCDALGLPDFTPPALQQAYTRQLAEAHASASQIGAVTGHTTLTEVQRYIDASNRETIATDSMDLLPSRLNGEPKVGNRQKKLAKIPASNWKKIEFWRLAIP